MPSDSALTRIETKLDQTLTIVNSIQVEVGRIEERVSNHIEDDEHEQSVIHKRIDKMQESNRWWAGKLFGAFAAGGGLLEAFHRFLGGNAK